MATADLLLDTDVLIDHLRGARPFGAGWSDAAYSVVTRCELFAGRAVEEEGVRAVLGLLRELPVDRAIAEDAGRIRRRSGVATPDAIIAATARAHDLTLVTRNRRHFERVDGLRLHAPDAS